MGDRTHSEPRFSHVVAAPVERVDIADRQFNLPDAGYQHCEYTNHVTATAADEFVAFILAHRISFDPTRAARRETSSADRRREIPLSAKSSENKAFN